MATETERLKKMLRNNWNGPMWYGSNLQETLKDISWEKAFYKPAHFTHNIYEYVMHLVCWRRFVTEHLNGNSDYKTELNSELDWITQYTKDELTWLKALAELEAGQTALLTAAENLTEEMLDELVPGKKFKWYVMLHGLIQHDVYHSAQIALLKK